MTRSTSIAAALALMILASGCTDDTLDDTAASDPASPSSSGSSAPASSPGASSAATSTPPTEPGTTITTGQSDFGPILLDVKHQAIYIWELEKGTTPQCYDDCAEAWPPVLTEGAPTARGQVDSGLLGTTPRRDGTTQVTYNGHPLYYYAHEGPGEVKCHNVSTHGGLWWVVTPNGGRAP